MLKKAMVFTLAAAMLVGTPLTASAAPFWDLYSISDGDTEGSVSGNATSTNTGTNTNTKTSTKTGTIEDEAKVTGIRLDQASVRMKNGETRKLTASLVWDSENLDDEDRALEAELLKSLVWKSEDMKTATVTPVKRIDGVATVRAKSAGETVITVSLDSEEHNLHYSAEAKVAVFQYADKLRFDNEKIEDDAYTGNSLILDDYVVRYIEDEAVDTTDDTLTFTLLDDGGKKATLKKGVLKLNKPTDANKPVKVVASGKNVRTENVGIINIQAGTNATKLTFSVTAKEAEDGAAVKGAKLTQLVNDNDDLETTVTAKVTGKKYGNSKDKTTACTDKITWSSENSGIVSVENVRGGDKGNGHGEVKDVDAGEAVNFKDDECDITLHFHSAGTTKIVGKVSSGKTFKLTVKVNADLTGVVLNNEEVDSLYTGQTIDLNDKIMLQQFGKVDSDSFTANGLVKWEFTNKKAMGNLAKLDAKTGALEIKPTVAKDSEITVRAIAAKTGKNIRPFAPEQGKNEITFKLEQVSINSITVTKTDAETPMISITPTEKQKNPKPSESINVGATAEYELKATGTIGEDKTEVDVTKALSWTASGKGKIIKAYKEGNMGMLTAVKKGSSTITVKGVTAKTSGNGYTTIKATFKETVNAPSQNITLSVKNKDIAAKYNKKDATVAQTITIKPVLDKGTTTRNKATGTDIIVWDAHLERNGEEISNAVSMSQGKLKLTAGQYLPGDKITVNAEVRNTGAVDTITMTVVYPTKKVAFKEYGEDGQLKADPIGSKKVPVGEGIDVCAYIQSSAKDGSGEADGVNRAGVASYTVSGKGSVFVKIGENGRITIEPLKKGDVTIKFVMTDGKKGNLKVTVSSDPAWTAAMEKVASFISDMFE